MRSLLFCLLSLLYFTSSAQSSDTSESWGVEMAANISYYNSLSVSIEKSFNYGKWVFGPRVELLNIFGSETYQGDDSTYAMTSQVRIRLAQVEYKINPSVRIGIAPFWMLGPLPRNSFYKTPTSVYAHIQLKENLSLETSFTSSQKEAVQISVRKML
jgi:hypothetical protein